MTHATPSSLRLEGRDLSKPDEATAPPHAKVETVRMQGHAFTRFTFLPGFHWRDDIGPLMQKDHCPGTHLLYQVSGRLRVRMKDGAERVFGAGEAQVIPPGHDVWVLGDEPVVLVAIE